MPTLSKSANCNIRSSSGFSSTESGIRLISLGRTGDGKSELGNFLLGRHEFETGCSAGSVTRESAYASTIFSGRKLIIVDTPGLFDTTLSYEKISTELTHTYYDVKPGPHAFLIVTRGRHTSEAETTLTLLIRLFGAQVVSYCIVIVTHEDDMNEDEITLDQYLGEANSPLRTFVNRCGGRCIAVNSKTNVPEERKEKLNKLLRYIDEIARSNLMPYFTHEKFQQAAIDEAHRQQSEEQKTRKDLGEDDIRHQENDDLQQREKETKDERQIHETNLKKSKEARDIERQQRGNGGAGREDVFLALTYVTLQVVCAIFNENNQSASYQPRNLRRFNNLNYQVYSNNDCCIT